MYPGSEHNFAVSGLQGGAIALLVATANVIPSLEWMTTALRMVSMLITVGTSGLLMILLVFRVMRQYREERAKWFKTRKDDNERSN